MNRCLVILFLFVSSLSIAGDRMCGVGPCPNPVANCVYTLDKGMVTETFEVWGDVRVTTNPYDADVWVYVVKSSGADLVVSWVDDPQGCGQWHKVDKDENFSVYFTNEEESASFTIRYGDAANEYYSRDGVVVLPY